MGDVGGEALGALDAVVERARHVAKRAGKVADLFGRKRVFLTGISTFALGSLAAGLAVNVPMLIASRAVQGLGGALMIPTSIASRYPYADSGEFPSGAAADRTAVQVPVGDVVGFVAQDHGAVADPDFGE